MWTKEIRGWAAGIAAGGTGLVVSAAALLAGCALVSAPAGAEQMIRYDRPVYHNGRRVLYHGAWRGGGGKAARAKAAKDDDEEDDPPKAAAAAAKPLASAHEFIVLVDTDDATSLRMATEMVNAAKAAGLKARAWAGKTSPAAIAKFVEADGGDFAVAAIDVLATDPKGADLRAKAPLVARLANEPVVVIAQNAISDIKQLDGKAVSFGEADGVVDASAQALFGRLGIAPKVVHENVTTSLASLAAGKIDAIVMLGADQSRAVNEAAKTGKYHAISIPWRDEFADRYAPARLTARDLPRLTPADGTVETIGVPFGLIAIDAPEGSARAAQDAPFVAVIFEKSQPLLGVGADPKWREVNLAAETDWPRLAPAREWIEKHRSTAEASLDSFRAAAKTADAASPGAAALADKLYQSLLRSGGAQ